MLQETYTLNNGVQVPRLGLGTWFVNNQKAEAAVQNGIEIGYRHIDTAQAYNNERGVGLGIRNCGIAREEIFLTTKLAAEAKTYAKAKAAIEKSLRTLGVDYIDLMLIHSPRPWTKFCGSDRYFEGNLEAWRALEEAHKAGKIRAIGVSNFDQVDLENILDKGTVKPAVNQVLAHISNTPFELIKYCQDRDILVQAYSPVGHKALLKNQQIVDMAEKYGVSVPQLCIKYDLQLGLLPIPKPVNPVQIKNATLLDFTVSNDDMSVLSNCSGLMTASGLVGDNAASNQRVEKGYRIRHNAFSRKAQENAVLPVI